MSSVILEAHDLTKEYRHTVALDHIDLKIEKGKIYGFIGQNGAGKTTFLRLVTGLAFPTSGTLSLWGKTVEKKLQEQRKRIGCMIETPALFPTKSAIFIIENPIDSKVEIDPNRLFERFYTGDKSRHNSGTGVGLAVVKLLTDKLGGNVFAKIENDTLTISLEIK